MVGETRRYLVTGGAGFIGSAVVRHLIAAASHEVVVLDKLTYAGNLDSLEPVARDPRFRFVRGDIADSAMVGRLIREVRPDAILHLAAESHVDRSIDAASAFVQTNVVGTQVLLEEALAYWRGLPQHDRDRFRFLHVSTDEVFGALGDVGVFNEDSPYRPTSPYAASKAASDHLARAWYQTHGLPVLVTNGSNTYGPYQFPEKLIPLVVLNCLEGRALPVYGRGANVRDWVFVEDHVRALIAVLERGRPGETYAIAGRCEKTNIEVVRAICSLMDEMAPDPGIGRREELIEYVADRPGHDYRYALDSSKIGAELDWTPQEGFESGLARTVRWYLDNRSWWGRIRSGVYRGERLGLAS